MGYSHPGRWQMVFIWSLNLLSQNAVYGSMASGSIRLAEVGSGICGGDWHLGLRPVRWDVIVLFLR